MHYLQLLRAQKQRKSRENACPPEKKEPGEWFDE
jgi:hypothetical protein